MQDELKDFFQYYLEKGKYDHLYDLRNFLTDGIDSINDDDDED
jgi:hypothetical protein